MKQLIAILTLATGALALALPAAAHETPARHGGIVKSVDDLQFELVSKGGKATLYVDDHGKPVPMAGASGKLTVLKGAQKSEVKLAPGGANTLVAAGSLTLEPGNKVVANVVFPDKKELTVRFAIK